MLCSPTLSSREALRIGTMLAPGGELCCTPSYYLRAERLFGSKPDSKENIPAYIPVYFPGECS